jgi:hypothetical protein
MIRATAKTAADAVSTSAELQVRHAAARARSLPVPSRLAARTDIRFHGGTPDRTMKVDMATAARLWRASRRTKPGRAGAAHGNPRPIHSPCTGRMSSARSSSRPHVPLWRLPPRVTSRPKFDRNLEGTRSSPCVQLAVSTDFIVLDRANSRCNASIRVLGSKLCAVGMVSVGE